MRASIVTTEYAGVTDYSGGIGTQYAELAPELVRQGHEVHVVTLSLEEPRRLERTGVQLHLERVPRGLLRRTIAWPLAVERALRRLGPVDVVVAPEYAAGASRYAGHRTGGPLVTQLFSSMDEIVSSSDFSRRQRLMPHVELQRRLERRQARRSDALLAPTEKVLRESRERWGLHDLPCSVIPNCISTARVRDQARSDAPAGFPRRSPVVAYFGRLEHRKGVHVLVEAMSVLWGDDEGAPPELVLLGGDPGWRGAPMANHLRGIAAAHAGRLHILGPQPAQRLFPAVAAAEVVVLPSLWDNVPLAALEAMALRSAMIVTRGTGFEEFLQPERDALFVEPGDPRALANAVRNLLRDEHLRERLRANAGAAAEKYDVRPVAARIAQYLSAPFGGAARQFVAPTGGRSLHGHNR
jgi:glycogen(starch) synthase